MIRPKPDVPERYPIISFPTPEGQSDLLFYETRDGDLPKNKAWTYGDPHPDAAKFPNHELVFVSAAEGGAGWQRWYYAANRENQHLYNWQFTDTTDWPQLAQTFIVRRSDFSVTSTYEMPPLDVIPYPLEWLATGIEERPINDETLASTFVTVVVTREKIRVRNQDGTYSDREIVGREFDPDTNSTTTYRRSKVPAGTTIPEGIQSNGSIIELQPVNTLWSIKNTKQAAGLAGKAIKGKALRTFQIVTNWAWPAVLDYVRIQRITADPGDAFSTTTGYTVVPIYSADAYSGPCLATIVEEWTSKLPVVGGVATWDTDMVGESPQLLEPTPLLPKSIFFDGQLLRVNVPECLHGTLDFYEGSFSQVFPATNYPRWPGSIVAEVNLSPNQGGWLKKTMIVNAPSQAGVQSEIVLELDEAFATSFRLKWNILSGTTVLNLDISTDPAFRTGSFLSGYNNLDVRSAPASNGFATKLVEGASRGVVYYCRLKSVRTDNNGTPSNPADDRVVSVQSATLAVTCPPLAEIYLSTPGSDGTANTVDDVDLPTGTGSLAFGATRTSIPTTKTIIIKNKGLLTLSNLLVSFPAGSDFSLSGALPTSVDSNDYEVITVRFAPTTIGSKTSTMTLTSNAANTPSYTVALTGQGTEPEIDVEYLGVSKPSGGSTISLGNVNTGVTGTFPFFIHNDGNAPLTAVVTITSAAEDGTIWTLDSAPEADIPVGGSDEFLIRFSPTAAGTKTLTVSIASNDDTGSENPYTLTLSATGIAVGSLRVTSPNSAQVSSGGSYYFGFSRFSPSTEKAVNFTLSNNGAGNLNSLSFAITGTGADKFSVGPLSPAVPITPGSSAALPVRFTPTAAGLVSATLTISSSDPAQPTFTVLLSGFGGSDREIQVESPLDSLIANNSVLFGSMLINETRVKRFWVRNVGNTRLTFANPPITITGTGASKFSFSALTPLVTHLEASESAYFDVTVTPGTDIGVFSATLKIFSDDADENPVSISLQAATYPAGSLATFEPPSLVLGKPSLSASDTSPLESRVITPSGLNPFNEGRISVSPTGRLAVSDTYANRVLIWNSYSQLYNGKPPDVILGQSYSTNLVANAVNLGTSANNFFRPKATAWYGDKLLVADTARYRILIWNSPTSNGQNADLVLGQSSFTLSSTSNTRTTALGHVSDIFVVPTGTQAGKVIVADSYNRVLIWNSFPTVSNAEPTFALGHPSSNNLLSRYSLMPPPMFPSDGVSIAGFAQPSSVCVSPTDGKFYVADEYHQRVLVYSAIPTSVLTTPSAVLFQPNFTSSTAGIEIYSRDRCIKPIGVSVSSTGQLAVAEEFRVTIFYSTPTTGSLPDAVLGQPSFETNSGFYDGGPTALVPKGLTWQGGDLLVKDESYSRVVIFKP
jgi:hypothetical protein